VQELQITHVRKNKKNRITHVQIDDKIYPESTIINWRQDGTYRCYTLVSGCKSYVLIKSSSLGNWFLTTSPDGVEVNNLNSLPSC
jgi:hypothetical protein